MITVNIHKAKTHFSHYVSLVQKGERVILCKRNIPIVELHLLTKDAPKRAIGKCKEKFDIPPSFYKPLPKNMLESFINPQ